MKYILTVLMISLSMSSYAQQPKLLLAKLYQSNIVIDDYWVSEKLDGVRAYWNGEKLISRRGYVFTVPKWFTEVLPNIALDGELWIERNRFDRVSGLVRRQDGNYLNWKPIKYMIFDLPDSKNSFDLRVPEMQKITQQVNADHFKAVKQFKIKSHKELHALLESTVNHGGEGLMLHLGSSYYRSGRSNDVLKLKKHFDAEATVVGHFKGKGKFANMLGSLLVETKNNIRFKIGTGFSDKERINPPPIGSVITYKYFSLSRKGTPRFASYLRMK